MNYENLDYHPTMAKLVNILQEKTQNPDPMFFRIMVSYFFCKMASMMRANVQIADGQVVPINMYAINLAPSGSGKGHSVNIIEEEVINAFRKTFLDDTFPTVAETNLAKLAARRAQKYQTDIEEERQRAEAEFEDLGQLLFSFDSATSAAVKQMRTKLLMAKAGSMNLEIDEIGSNLLSNGEVLNAYLELYDTGKIKQKLIKNTRDNVRMEDLVGSTPTNMMMFGTPTKLLNGSKTEDEFYDFLEIGYARRCFFGSSRRRKSNPDLTAQDLYDVLSDQSSNGYLSSLSRQFESLAKASMFNRTLKFDKPESLALLEYRIRNQNMADDLSDYDELKKAELSHRHFKVAKLAGALAFIDKTPKVEMDHLKNAIALAEDSGIAFQNILKRDRPYVKLADYLAAIGEPVTHADLIEDLPFYKGTEAQRRDNLNLAIAHGYKHGIYIKREIVDGIDFLSGRKVPETDLDSVRVSVSSKDITTGYSMHEPRFDKLHQMVAVDGFHWVTHKLKDGYRKEANAIPGFNLIVLDVDDSVSIDMAKSLLEDYTYLLYTTKRHTDKNHRYRIVMPISHFLELDANDYKEFMANIFEWLPFDVDTQTGQRARKWLSSKGNYWYNDAQLLDALQFVPKTKKAEEQRQLVAQQGDLSALERWFLNKTAEGNRNNQLMHYAFHLVDMGHDLNSVQSLVLGLNRKLNNPLEETEVLMTVIASASKKIAERRSK